MRTISIDVADKCKQRTGNNNNAIRFCKHFMEIEYTPCCKIFGRLEGNMNSIEIKPSKRCK